MPSYTHERIFACWGTSPIPLKWHLRCQATPSLCECWKAPFFSKSILLNSSFRSLTLGILLFWTNSPDRPFLRQDYSVCFILFHFVLFLHPKSHPTPSLIPVGDSLKNLDWWQNIIFADKIISVFYVSLTNLSPKMLFLHEKNGNDFVVITAYNGCSLRESNPQLQLRSSSPAWKYRLRTVIISQWK